MGIERRSRELLAEPYRLLRALTAAEIQDLLDHPEKLREEKREWPQTGAGQRQTRKRRCRNKNAGLVQTSPDRKKSPQGSGPRRKAVQQRIRRQVQPFGLPPPVGKGLLP